MSETFCVCGTENGSGPVIITITACRRKHPLSGEILDQCEPVSTINLRLPPDDKQPLAQYDADNGQKPPDAKCDLDPLSKAELKTVVKNIKDKQKGKKTMSLPKMKLFSSTPKSKKSKQQVYYANKSAALFLDDEDASTSYPLEVRAMLPLVKSRYHGSGCAMEVCIFEKHESSCRFKKLRNKDRNPADDKVGSYEAIGRLTFRTCNNETSENTVSDALSVLQTDESLPEAIKQQLVHRKVIETLAKSSKSFTTYFTNKTIYEDSKTSIYNLNGCDGEEIMLNNPQSTKSVQFSEVICKDNKHKHSRWYRLFLTCLGVSDTFEDDEEPYSQSEICLQSRLVQTY